MVHLTMTSAIVEALEKIQSLERLIDEKGNVQVERKRSGPSFNDQSSLGTSTTIEEQTVDIQGFPKDDSTDCTFIDSAKGQNEQSNEPSLSNPKIGNPISHGQVTELSRKLKAQRLSPKTLDLLLRGARVYVPPPPSKPEKVVASYAQSSSIYAHYSCQTSEYKALMAHLRREEEARSYKRMVNPPPPSETFVQRFPMSSAAHAFPSYKEPEPEDDYTYADVNRQMAMIANVLLSIFACAGAIWIAARWWSTPARLALSMSGSLLVGIAEVVVYGGYIRRVSEAKGKENSIREIKEVVRTWVVGGEKEDESQDPILLEERQGLDDVQARRRQKAAP